MSPRPTSPPLSPCGNLPGVHAPSLLLPFQTPEGSWADLTLDWICIELLCQTPPVTSLDGQIQTALFSSWVTDLLSMSEIFMAFLPWKGLFSLDFSYTIPFQICFLLHLCACSVPQCVRLRDAMDCSPPSSPVHDSPGKNAGVGCHFLLQGIFPTQGWNLSAHSGLWITHSWILRSFCITRSLDGNELCICLPKYFLPRVSLIM